MIALHLLRHAHAGDPAKWRGDDADRPLSDRGVHQAELLARLLTHAEEAPDLFITSPKVRARQTAEILGKALKVKVAVDPRLSGIMLELGTVTDIVLAAGHDAVRPCLVGHEPSLSDLLMLATGAATLPMRKGALARVDFPGAEALPGRGVLQYLVPPELLDKR